MQNLRHLLIHYRLMSVWGNVAVIGEKLCAYMELVAKHERKKPLGRPKSR